MAAEYSGKKIRKGATKHCCWGNCTNDTRYPHKFPPGTYFMPFPKVGRIKESMTQWEKNRQNERTEKAKKWIHACGRKNFGIKNITRSTYICSIHFVGGHGPTEADPCPLLATLTEGEKNKKLSRKRKQPTRSQREPLNHPDPEERTNKTTNKTAFSVQPDNIFFDNADKKILIEDIDTPPVADISKTQDIAAYKKSPQPREPLNPEEGTAKRFIASNVQSDDIYFDETDKKILTEDIDTPPVVDISKTEDIAAYTDPIVRNLILMWHLKQKQKVGNN